MSRRRRGQKRVARVGGFAILALLAAGIGAVTLGYVTLPALSGGGDDPNADPDEPTQGARSTRAVESLGLNPDKGFGKTLAWAFRGFKRADP